MRERLHERAAGRPGGNARRGQQADDEQEREAASEHRRNLTTSEPGARIPLDYGGLGATTPMLAIVSPFLMEGRAAT